ncbi:MAG: sigma-70 family RNA polymerase sigma factor [Puniceicoccales bacterium]|jgi:RNA polymerase sigma-70 factor (ECF subfamily)|nr:sigma-70 family RNA polymerase sigma factor [Puniceicoccales bacterium]
MNRPDHSGSGDTYAHRHDNSNVINLDSILVEILPTMRVYAISLLKGNSHGVEEVLQECLIYIWQQRTELPQIRNLRAWALRVVYFKTLSYRRDNADNLLHDLSADLVSRIADAVERDADNDDPRLEALHKCVNQLPEEEHNLIRLFYEKNLSFKEISDRVRKKEPAVRKQVSRLRRSLRWCVEKTLKK